MQPPPQQQPQLLTVQVAQNNFLSDFLKWWCSFLWLIVTCSVLSSVSHHDLSCHASRPSFFAIAVFARAWRPLFSHVACALAPFPWQNPNQPVSVLPGSRRHGSGTAARCAMEQPAVHSDHPGRVHRWLDLPGSISTVLRLMCSTGGSSAEKHATVPRREDTKAMQINLELPRHNHSEHLVGQISVVDKHA